METKASIIESLADLLANRQVSYTNLRGLHWDIKGDKFYELHTLYEEYYNGEAEAIDELAERIVMLGGRPENRFSEYLKVAEIKETHNVSDWKQGVDQVLATWKMLQAKYHALDKLATAAGDVTTHSIVEHHLSSIEANLWKLGAYAS